MHLVDHPEVYFLVPVLIATLAGSLIGIERELRHKAAGMGTNMLICAGACVFAILSAKIDPGSPSRIAANVLTGVGFIGAGLIIKQSNKEHVTGLTTAAGIWMAAAIGVSFGTEHYIIGTMGTLIAVVAPRLPRWAYYRKAKKVMEKALDEDKYRRRAAAHRRYMEKKYGHPRNHPRPKHPIKKTELPSFKD